MHAKLTSTLLAAAAALATVGALPAAAQGTQALAPPVSQPGNAVWDWREIPINERIPIVRAVFDQSGYQLIDESGQTIFVPFAGNNLYVMRFGRTDGQMFFVNEDGRTPTLYVPEGVWLENATVGGARWYPFPNRYYYTRPVFLGPAPTWDAYCNMGWYPGMVIYGGYWCNDPWRFGVTLRPMTGLYISVGGRNCYGWDDYVYYYRATPARRMVFIDRPVVRQTVIVNRDRRDYSLPPRKDVFVRDRDNNRGGYDGNRGYSRYETRNGVPYTPPRSDNNGGGRYDRGDRGNGGVGNGNNGGGRYDNGNRGGYDNNRNGRTYEVPRSGYSDNRPAPPTRSGGGYSGRESGGYSAPRDNGGGYRREAPPQRDNSRSDSGSSRGREERRQRG